jgi:hypothetical protein
MTCHTEIHVGDIGTLYHVEILDAGTPFDPDGATVTQLIFKMPNGAILRKDATVTTDGSPADQWFLDYEVQAGDGLGSPGEFHDNEGILQVQAFLEWGDGRQWHSDVVMTDTDGQELRIFPNLD